MKNLPMILGVVALIIMVGITLQITGAQQTPFPTIASTDMGSTSILETIVSTATPSGMVTAGPTSDKPSAGLAPTSSRITDLDPQLPRDDKVTVVVRHADGSYEDFLMSPEKSSDFMNRLPSGDQIANLLPRPNSIKYIPQEEYATEKSATLDTTIYTGQPGPADTPVAPPTVVLVDITSTTISE